MPDHSAAAAHPQALGARLFSFAVIADTHLNQGETTCNSPFEINRLANGRLRHVVRDLNTRDVAFVVNLGDLVHPVPAIPDLYAAAAERFQEQVAELRYPLHLVPGNHDVGDKPIDWAPAGVVTDAFLDLWSQYFGPHYYGFDHGECRFPGGQRADHQFRPGRRGGAKGLAGGRACRQRGPAPLPPYPLPRPTSASPRRTSITTTSPSPGAAVKASGRAIYTQTHNADDRISPIAGDTTANPR